MREQYDGGEKLIIITYEILTFSVVITKIIRTEKLVKAVKDIIA